MARSARINLYLTLCQGLVFRLLAILLLFIVAMAGSGGLHFNPVLAEASGMLILFILIRREFAAYLKAKQETETKFFFRYELIYIVLAALHFMPVFIPMKAEIADVLSVSSRFLSLILSCFTPVLLIKELRVDSGETELRPPT